MPYTLEFLNTDPSVQRIDKDKWFIPFDDETNSFAGIFFIHVNYRIGELCEIPIDIMPDDGTPFYTSKAWHHMPSSNGGLSLMPSIACRLCGTHGYIWEGLWTEGPAPMSVDRPKPEVTKPTNALDQFVKDVVGGVLKFRQRHS